MSNVEMRPYGSYVAHFSPDPMAPFSMAPFFSLSPVALTHFCRKKLVVNPFLTSSILTIHGR